VSDSLVYRSLRDILKALIHNRTREESYVELKIWEQNLKNVGLKIVVCARTCSTATTGIVPTALRVPAMMSSKYWPIIWIHEHIEEGAWVWGGQRVSLVSLQINTKNNSLLYLRTCKYMYTSCTHHLIRCVIE
jgi:hypothetical protein